MHYDAFAAAAAAEPPPALVASPAPAPEPTWTRRDDKFLELLYFTRNTVDSHSHAASGIIGKTPEQMRQRYNFMFAELRHVLESLEVSTPPVWDMEIVATAAASAAEEVQVVSGAVVLAAPPVAAVEGSAARAVGAGGGARKKKKKAEKWTEYEHRRFLAGLPFYRGKWNVMSREYLPSRTASQIASHYQKYQKREKQRERDTCKRASIHDITDPGIAASVANSSGGDQAATTWKGELPRSEANARGEESESQDPIESGEDGLSPVEEFPGEDDLGTLFT